MTSLSGLLQTFEFESLGDGHYRGVNAPEGPGVVFGGQLIAQSLLLAGRDHPGKLAKTVHTIFARARPSSLPSTSTSRSCRAAEPSGRAPSPSPRRGSSAPARWCCSPLTRTTRSGTRRRRRTSWHPRRATPSFGTDDWEVAIVGGVDINDPAFVGPAELDVWTRFAGAPDDDALLAQALVAYTTDPFLIATAMLPHEGVGQSLAHVSFSTGVISHTLTFHEQVHADRWLLLAHDSPHAGHGRSYGRANVFQDGHLVASFVQDAMIRAMPGGHSGGHL